MMLDIAGNCHERVSSNEEEEAILPDSETLNGGCNCGQVRYAITAPPLAVAACHCTSCRRQSGAAHSVNLVVGADAMQVTGVMATWNDPDTESGKPVSRQFCPICGSPIRSLVASAPNIIAVKAGTLDAPDAFAPTLHVWTRSALPWVTIPAGVPSFAKGPAA